MNERIQELIKQATSIQGPTPYNPITFEVFDKEKFAELIIQECERVAKDPQWYSERPSNGWRNPINHVCQAFKEHFGVE